MITNKMKSKTLCVMLNMLLACPTFAMDEESNDYSNQLSIYNDWQIVDYSNVCDNSIDNNEEDFELKAKALGNTVLALFGGAAVSVCNFGINLIENKIQTNVNQFDRGMRMGSQLVGNLYGQGIALENAYENEKSLLKKGNSEK